MKFVIVMWALLHSTMAAAEILVVSRDLPDGPWQEARLADGPSLVDAPPNPLEQLARSGVSFHFPEDKPRWEMLIPVLMPDGNVWHLVGQAVKISALGTMQRISAQLQATQSPDCHMRLEAVVDEERILFEDIEVQCAGTHRVLALAVRRF